ncbi:MAG: DNA polymerase III subunit beta [Buchnera aphidicola (Eriosoma harunire)]
MNFTIEKQVLLQYLQKISVILNKNLHLPILNNILLNVQHGFISLTTTNIDIEITVKIALTKPHSIGIITVPCRKFLQICRLLPSESIINIYLDVNKIIIKSFNVIFSLCTLSSNTFPLFPKTFKNSQISFSIPEKIFKYMIEATYFCMAKQDIRLFLNGMLFEINDNIIRTISTDGYRLAICNLPFNNSIPSFSVIIARQSIIELNKILSFKTDLLNIFINNQHIIIQTQNLTFITKLIDEKFPNCSSVLDIDNNKVIEINTKNLKNALLRISILCNEQYKGITFNIYHKKIQVISNNQEDEYAEEIIDLHYENNINKLKFSCNVHYIIAILNVIKGDYVRFILNNPISHITIEDTIKTFAKYIVMPLHI